MSKKNSDVNRCQYWSTYEPAQCIYWDDAAVVCTYKADDPKNPDATYAPYCNLIGTFSKCDQYESPTPGIPQARCILPDTRRHVCNRDTGEKWVTSSGTDISGSESLSGYDEQMWSFETITGYNDGDCDGAGTDTTCSGYAPYHLGFGVLQPSAEEDIYDTFKEIRYSKTSDFGYRLPTNFVVYNIRAVLGKCFWWKDDPGVFTVNKTTGKVELSDTWKCTCPEDTSAYSEFTLEDGPPCNGCKPECSNYTALCWKYCIDEYMETGDPILAEQVHELRYYHREQNWTVEAIQSKFIDEGTIFTWDGSKTIDQGATSYRGNLTVLLRDNNRIEGYEIPSIKVEMQKFDAFDPVREHLVLTEGTNLTKRLKDYPTLIRELQLLPLSPIIKNKFYQEENRNFFEVKTLKDVHDVSIFGKMFYKDPVYALNISDKEFASLIPRALFDYDNIYEIEEDFTEENYTHFNNRITALLDILVELGSESLVTNTLSNEEGVFILDVPLLSKNKTITGTNENTLLVFQQSSGVYTYDKITVNKRFIGGVYFQSEFTIEGDGGYIKPYIPYFEKSFMASRNDNGQMSFDFTPFVSEDHQSKVIDFYNDFYHQDELTEDIYQGFKEYEITIEDYILEIGGEKNEVTVLGPNGYLLVNFNSKEINSLYKAWEVEKIEYNYEVEELNDQGKLEKTTKTCEMEVKLHPATGKLPASQVIIGPKDVSKYTALCGNNGTIIFKNLKYWMKKSFEQTPEIALGEYEEVEVRYLNSVDAGVISGNANSFTIRKFKFVLTLTAVIADSTGVPFAMSSIKPIGWVQQPACPDVEIFYNWKGEYTKFQNIPICVCCGPWHEDYRVKGAGFFMVPQCGDHFESPAQTKGPMFWPYNRCAEYASYDMVTNLSNWDLELIGLFKEKSSSGGYVHGSHDMRMLGPHRNYAKPGLPCNPLKPCSCEFETFNYHQDGESQFIGWGKVRSGVPTPHLQIWARCGSPVLPQFGNEKRSVFRSYRTTGQVPYIKRDINLGTGEVKLYTDWFLMPEAMTFSKSDITEVEDQMWETWTSASNAPVINPMGFYLAKDFDGVTISEEIDIDGRHRFEDVFTCRSTANIGYPRTQGEYVVMRGDTRICPWYEYKKINGQYVQWAWQEIWKPVERMYSETFSFSDMLSSYLSQIEESNQKGMTISDDSMEYTYFVGLNVEYPSYQYNWENKEFRLMLDEGDNKIIFTAPEKDPSTGIYNGYPAFNLEGGPRRGICWSGEWLTEDNKDEDYPAGNIFSGDLDGDYNVDLYDTCVHKKGDEIIKTESGIKTHYKWATEVTLFAKGYTNPSMDDAASDDRMCWKIRPLMGGIYEYDKIHFQRGLKVSFDKGALANLPLALYPILQYEVTGDVPNAVCGTVGFYWNIEYTFDEIYRTVGAVDFSYKFGPELLVDDEHTGTLYRYYHKPGIQVKDASGNIVYQETFELYSGPDKGAYEVINRAASWKNTWDYIRDGGKGCTITFLMEPDASQIELAGLDGSSGRDYNNTLNMVEVTSIGLKEEVLVNSQEPIYLWERKYNVSTGGGVMPPHGDGDSKVLVKLAEDQTTVWQVDNNAGVQGISGSKGTKSFVHKVRGRHVEKVYEDEHQLTGSIPEMENLQESLFNDAVAYAQQTTSMEGVLPPSLSKRLNDLGVVFDGPNELALKNTLPSNLAPINQFPPMQGQGHSYLPGDYYKDTCQTYGQKCVDSGRGGDVYYYYFTNRDESDGASLFSPQKVITDSLHQYYWGGYWMLQRRDANENLHNYVFPKLYSRSTGHTIYNASSDSFFDKFYPPMPIKLTGSMGGSFSGGISSSPIDIPFWGGFFLGNF